MILLKKISIKCLRWNLIINLSINIYYIMKVHIGPGIDWKKPDNTWITIDCEKSRGDIVCDFNKFTSFPISDNSVEAIYSSHTFEHISIFNIKKVFKECNRILCKGGVMRIIVPDPRRSMIEYLAGNEDYEYFKSMRKRHGSNLTLFQCLRLNFLSPSGQTNILGKDSLAHQNGWDFESLQQELVTYGNFEKHKIKKVDFKNSCCNHFNFEGTYNSEANHTYRSLYVEAEK